MTKSLWTLAALVLAVSCAAFMRNIRANQSPAHGAQETSQQPEVVRRGWTDEDLALHEQRRHLKTVPMLITETPSLQIIGTEIVPQAFGDSDGLRLTLQNKSAKSVASFTICNVLEDSFLSSETFASLPGYTMIEPYGEVSKMIHAESIEPDKPLTLCAMMYVDGTQEGVPRVLKMHEKASEERKKQYERKEKP